MKKFNIIFLLCLLVFGTQNYANANCSTCPAGQSEVVITVYGDQWVDEEGSLEVTVNGTSVTVTNLRTGATGNPVDFSIGNANITASNEWWSFSIGCQADGATIVANYFDTCGDGNTTTTSGASLFIFSDGVEQAAYVIPSGSGCADTVCEAGCATGGDAVVNNCPMDNSSCADPGANIAILAAGVTSTPSNTDLAAAGGENVIGDVLQSYGAQTQCATFTATSTEMNLFFNGVAIESPDNDACGFGDLNLELFDATCTSLNSVASTSMNYASFTEGVTYTLCGTYSYSDGTAVEQECLINSVNLAVSPVVVKCTGLSYWINGSPTAAEGWGTCQDAVLTDPSGCFFDSGGPNGNYVPGTGPTTDRHITNVCPDNACTVDVTITYDLNTTSCLVGGDPNDDKIVVYDGPSRAPGDQLTILTGNGTFSFTSTGECFAIYSEPFCPDAGFAGFCVSWETATTGCTRTWTAGDDCADPIILQPGDNESTNTDATSGPRYNAGVIVGGTSTACEPASTASTGLCTTTFESTVYHQFTACAAGTISAQMIAEAGCANPPQFSVWEITNTSDPCNNLSAVDCNQSGGAISFTATAGTEYMLVVDGFAGTECNYNLQLSGQICPTPSCPTTVEFGTEFNNLNDVDGTFFCETGTITLDASNPDVIATGLAESNYGEFVSPGFRWIIEGDGFSSGETYTNIYSANDPFTSTPADPADATYGTGGTPDDGVGEFTRIHCSVDGSYTISICDVWGDGQIPYTIFDLNGNLIASGIADFDAIPGSGSGSNECVDIVVGAPSGTGGLFSGTGVTNVWSGDGTYPNSSLGLFDASAVAATYAGTNSDIVYTWDNQNGCTGTQTQTVTVFKEIVSVDDIVCTPGSTVISVSQDDASLTATYSGTLNGSPVSGSGFSVSATPPVSGSVTFTITNPNAPAALAGTNCEQIQVVVPVDCALPVELLSFDGEIVGRTNKLSWATASEINNSHFVVERSSNGERFVEIGKVQGNGTTVDITEYDFIDNTPLSMSYYRLKQVDFDGSFEYSNIINLERARKALEITEVFPVPASTNISIQFNAKSNADITFNMIDILGRTLSSEVVGAQQGINNHSIDVSNLSVGVYYIQMTDGANSDVRKIVKE